MTCRVKKRMCWLRLLPNDNEVGELIRFAGRMNIIS